MHGTAREERGRGRGHGEETGNERMAAGPPTTMKSPSEPQDGEGRKRGEDGDIGTGEGHRDEDGPELEVNTLSFQDSFSFLFSIVSFLLLAWTAHYPVTNALTCQSREFNTLG